MASKSTTLAIKIVGDASNGIKALDDTESRTGRFLSGMGTAAVVGAGAVVGVIGAIGVAAFNAASDLQQSTGAIDSVFGDWALDIEQSAQAAHDAVGLSTSDYENLASVIGAQLHGAGMAHDEMTGKTQTLIEKGADLAATFGGTTADAVEALSSTLKGEFDPIERYGVSLKQSDINARLAAAGQDKLTGTALKTATANAALALITEQTASSQGAFARESDTAAGASARLSAWFENTKASLGEKLLPMFVSGIDLFRDKVVPAIDNMTRAGGPLQTFLSQASDIIRDRVVPAAAQMFTFYKQNLGPIIGELGGILSRNLLPAFRVVTDIVSTYFIPIFQRVAGPVLQGVRAVIGDVSEAVERNRGRFQAMYENLQPLLAFLRDKVAPFVGGTLKLAFEGAGKVIGFLVDKIAWVLEKGSAVAGFVGKLFGSGSPASQAAGRGAAPLFGAARTASPLRAASLGALAGGTAPAAGQGLVGAVTNIYVTVNGALDADAVADQVVGLIERRAARTGQRVAVIAA